MADFLEPKTETIAETDNYISWKSEEPDGEILYHIEVNNVTVHFFNEEWQEFLDLMRLLVSRFSSSDNHDQVKE